MEHITGKIVDYDGTTATIKAPYDNTGRLCLRQYETVEIIVHDGRKRTAEQNSKVHVLISEIADWMGDMPDYVKRLMKHDFLLDRIEGMSQKVFSMSDCSVTVAREFITFLIETIIEHGIPTKQPTMLLCDDIEKYVYACLMNKKCAYCRKPAQLHHVDQIGIGGDRKTKYQIGMKVLPLCAECHGACHAQGRSWIDEAHLIPIPLTAEIGKVYKLTKRNIERE